MRKAQENPKAKQSLLDAAESLMLKQGYAATSVESICQCAQLTKGSFFHYFKSKDDLGQAVLKRFCCRSEEKIQEACCNQNEKDPLSRIYGYIDHIIKMSRDPALKGCLVGTFAQELSDTHPQIRLLCEQSFTKSAKFFHESLREAKKKYAPKSQIDVDSLSEYFLAVFEGSLILARAKRNKKIIEESMQHLKRYIKSLFHQ